MVSKRSINGTLIIMVPLICIATIVVFLCMVHGEMVSPGSSSSYVAAVVEYAPVSNFNSTNREDVFLENVANYVKFIEEASKSKADIIVFPELGLSSVLAPRNPDGTPYLSVVLPEINSVPCKSISRSRLDQGIITLSCAAKDYNMYVVVNLPEKEPCSGTSCPSAGAIFYNANMVFDRSGAVVSRYRKFNLFGERGFSPPAKPQISVFDTDFGVRFGIFTCFDIMFENPAVSLVRDHGITDIVFPTAWFSEMPFLTAIQIQEYWSHRFDVNFLGSGYNWPETGSSGSGIYNGKNGTLTAILPSVITSKLLIASVPKKDGPVLTSEASMEKSGPIRHSSRNLSLDHSAPILARASNWDQHPGGPMPTKLRLMRDQLDVYTTRTLDPKAARETLKTRLCSGNLCCNFNYSVVNDLREPRYRYRLAVFDGVRSFAGISTGGIMVCAVITCSGDDLKSCGLVDFSDAAIAGTNFRWLSIEGSFRLNSTMQAPNTLGKGFLPLSTQTYTYEMQIDGKNMVKVSMKTVPDTSLSFYTFGIYGRDFSKDGEEATSLPLARKGSVDEL